jgi:hypothetical protein
MTVIDSVIDQREEPEARLGRTSALPTTELVLCGLLAFVFPASMSTPWGSLGAYVSAAISSVALLGIMRARPSFAEIQHVTPFFMVALIVAATAIAAMTQQYDWVYVRGTPVQWTALLGVSSLAGLWQIRGGDPRRWAVWLLWASAIISGLAIYEYISKDYVRLDGLYSALSGIHFDDTAYHRSPDSFRSISTLGNPLALGTLTAVTAVGAFGLYLERASLFCLLVFVANVIATFSSLSRSCWLALLLGAGGLLITYIFKSGAGVIKMHLHLLGGATLAVVLITIPASREYVFDRFSESFATASGRILELRDSISYSHRTSAVTDAVGSMIDSPYSVLVGFGLGAENSYFLGKTATPLTGVTTKDASLIRTFDNTYATVVYCFGGFGLVWFVRIICIRLRDGIAYMHRRYWYVGMLAAAAICLYFYNGISAPSASYLLACLLGFRFDNNVTVRTEATTASRLVTSRSRE